MKQCAICGQIVDRLYKVTLCDPHENDAGYIVGNIHTTERCFRCVPADMKDEIRAQQEKIMTTKFERAFAVWLFGIFGNETGANILRVFYRIYYGCIYYPQIYWLKAGNTARRIYLRFLIWGSRMYD